MKRCLYCYQVLADNVQDFHPVCSKKFFGQPIPPTLSLAEAQMEEFATRIIRSRIAVTGVQPKISLELTDDDNASAPKRLTIVGLWGTYILKPPPAHYAELPEIEDLTMHLARIAGIDVVPHSLIRLQTGALAYITKRIDRAQGQKIHLEDMCQLTERLTEEKYHGSYEQVAKVIQRYSVRPGLDVVNFFEQVLFCFLTGNADMHLKNFSLLHSPTIGTILAPGYDMVATALVNPDDAEDTALTLNGKKKNITRKDVISACTTLKLTPQQQENILKKLRRAQDPCLEFIEQSFLSGKKKREYQILLRERFARLYGET
jgi:serine/threonine-protein kinase HipA